MRKSSIIKVLPLILCSVIYVSCSEECPECPEDSTPKLAVSVDTLDFGNNLITKNLYIVNRGDGSLSWNLSRDSTWIGLGDTTGSVGEEVDTITVTADRTGRLAGDYSGIIAITSNGGSDAVTCIMTVPTEPTLAILTDSLDFGYMDSAKYLYILNTGKGTLNWSMTMDSSWLSIDQSSGTISTEVDTISITVNRSAKDPGTYVENISITSNGGSDSVKCVMTIPGYTDLLVSTDSLDFGDSETQLTFNISNAGSDTLYWLIDVDSTWLNIDAYSGTTTTEIDSITVIVDRTGKAPGDYFENVIVYNGNNVNDRDTITASMNVPAVPILSASTDSLDFGTIDSISIFNISNSGSGSLSWNLAADSSWITLEPTSGTTTTESDPITVTVNRYLYGMLPDIYSGNIIANAGGFYDTIKVVTEVPLGKIAFQSNRDGDYDIFVMNEDGSYPINLTNNDIDDSHTHISIDGKKVVYRSLIGTDSLELFIIDVDEPGTPVQLTYHGALVGDPRISPDGTKVLYYANYEGNNEIYWINTNGIFPPDPNLTNNIGQDYDPIWSPDGSQIMFVSDRDGGDDDIIVMDFAGGPATNLTNSYSSNDFTPSWSPDGNKIAFCSDRDGNYEIYTMNADGTNIVRLTFDSASDTDTWWSPDGSRIVFQSDRDGDTDLWIMNDDGSNQQNMMNNTWLDVQPSWSR